MGRRAAIAVVGSLAVLWPAAARSSSGSQPAA